KKADCTIAMTDSDLLALMTGKMNPQTAFFQGKLKITGNMGMAMKLQNLQLKPGKAKLTPTGPPQSRYDVGGGSFSALTWWWCVSVCGASRPVGQRPVGQHPVGQHPVGQHPVGSVLWAASCGQRPVPTDEGLEDDQHCTVQQQSTVVQPSANGANRMTHGGHHCSLDVCNGGCWVSQVPRALRASSTARLDPPSQRTHGRQVSRLFSVLAPRWWNELPLAVRTAESFAVFKRRLKTRLFVMHFSISTGPRFGQCLSSCLHIWKVPEGTWTLQLWLLLRSCDGPGLSGSWHLDFLSPLGCWTAAGWTLAQQAQRKVMRQCCLLLCVALLGWTLVMGQRRAEPARQVLSQGQKEKTEELGEKELQTKVEEKLDGEVSVSTQTKPEGVCPEKCGCTGEGAVDCAGVDLTEFPQELPDSTRQLSLQNNRITEVRVEDLSRLLQLETLNLQNNRLTTQGLEDEGFEVLEKLGYLYLANNKLTAAPRHLPPALVSADFAANQLTKIYPYTFGQKPALKSVYLHNNKLTEAGLPEGMFNGSNNLEVLIMSSNFLRYVPKDLPSALYRLHLKNNKLEKIPAGAFENLSQLRELYLQNNLLSNDGMDNNTFSHLTSLEYLDLSNNNLTEVPSGLPRSIVLLHLEKNSINRIPADALTPIRNLQYLLLHNNRLRARSIDWKAFHGLKRLHTLHMYNNLLERVPRGLPRRAKTLMILHNMISEIGRDDLNTLHTLTELNLSYNRLTSSKLHPEAFRKLRVLESLDLSGNRLQSLPLGLPKSLHVLKVKDNLIEELPEGSLAGMGKLRELYLSNNQLRINSIYQGAWQELGSLTTLDLSTNLLSHVPADLPESLEFIHLQHNKINSIPSTAFLTTPNIKGIFLSTAVSDTAVLLDVYVTEHLSAPLTPVHHGLGISLEGRTDLYRLDNGTLTAIRYQDEILGPAVRPYAGAVGPGFLLVHNNARPHVARVCRQFLENEGIDTIDWPTGSPDLNPIEHLWEHHQVALQSVQELSDALVQIWEEIPRTPSVISLGACQQTELTCAVCGSAIRFNRLSALSVAEDSFSHLSKLQVLDIGHGNIVPIRNQGEELDEDYVEKEEEQG
ncbi:hypothetical protein NFI96_033069, partial [Prochilodus magdalenae]